MKPLNRADLSKPHLNSWASLLALALALWSCGCHHTRLSPFPIGIYSVSNTNDLAEIRAAGFNTIAGAATKNFLDAARAANLKVLAAPDTSAGPDFSALNARRSVSRFDSHPALWAWYLVDEPDLHQIPPERVFQTHRFIKRLKATKPTALVLFKGTSALHYADCADILMIDRYPIPWQPLASVSQHVRFARFAAGKQKPLIAVIQAHDWSYYPELLPGEKDLRPPTYEEMRCMTYSALAERANGIFYYCFNDGRWKMAEHLETWEALKRVIREINQWQPLFEAEHRWFPHNQDYADRSRAFNAVLMGSITPALLRVRKGNEFVPPGDYMLTVNTSPHAQTHKFYLPGVRLEAIPVLGEDRFVVSLDGWVEDEFAPYAVHVYGPLPASPKRSW